MTTAGSNAPVTHQSVMQLSLKTSRAKTAFPANITNLNGYGNVIGGELTCRHNAVLLESINLFWCIICKHNIPVFMFLTDELTFAPRLVYNWCIKKNTMSAHKHFIVSLFLNQSVLFYISFCLIPPSAVSILGLLGFNWPFRWHILDKKNEWKYCTLQASVNLIRFVLAHLTHLHTLQMMTDTRYNSSSHDRCTATAA